MEVDITVWECAFSCPSTGCTRGVCGVVRCAGCGQQPSTMLPVHEGCVQGSPGCVAGRACYKAGWVAPCVVARVLYDGLLHQGNRASGDWQLWIGKLAL